MAKYTTLSEAKDAGDGSAETEIRYRLFAEVFEGMPQLRSNLNSQLGRAKAEIVRLRTMRDAAPKQEGKVVAFDAERFRKSSG
ncbi:MAG: hypothetical protein WBH51_04845 [Mycolicibacter algericus]